MPLTAPPVLDTSVYNATLVARRDFNPELSTFRVAFSDGPVPDFKPGQYCTIGRYPHDATIQEQATAREAKLAAAGKPVTAYKAKLVRRAYSIASPPSDTQALDLFIVRVDGGQLTPLLFELQPGDPLFVDPRLRGTFTLDGVPDGKDLVFVGTGTGLAPFLSMYHQFKGTGRWRRVVLIHGCRYAADLGYGDDLARLAEADPTLTYLPAVTREPEDGPWTGLRGRVPTLLTADRYPQLTDTPLDPAQCHVFLCGNPAMIDQVSADLSQRGFVIKDREHPDGNVHFERYW